MFSAPHCLVVAQNSQPPRRSQVMTSCTGARTLLTLSASLQSTPKSKCTISLGELLSTPALSEHCEEKGSSLDVGHRLLASHSGLPYEAMPLTMCSPGRLDRIKLFARRCRLKVESTRRRARLRRRVQCVDRCTTVWA
jgi:hypothetical protein